MKRARIIVLIVVAVLFGALLCALLLPREPVYAGRPVSEWIEQLTGGVGSGAGAVSSQALPALVQQKPGPEIVPYLRTTLYRGRSVKDRVYASLYAKLPPVILRHLPGPNPARDAELRYRAGLILYYLGADAKKAWPDLARALQDENQEVRRIAASALGSVGPDARACAAGLIAVLRDPVTDVRRAALKSLARVQDDPAIAVPAIARMLKDPDDGVRTDSAQLLKDFGPRAAPAVRSLVDALRDPNDDVFRFAAMALGRIGRDAYDAVPALRQALFERGPYNQATIRWALRQIDEHDLTNADLSH